MKELTDRGKVLKWLDSICEFDECCRGVVIEKCKTDKEARKYFVSRYAEVEEVIIERAAIKEFCAGMSREQADKEAWDEFDMSVKKRLMREIEQKKGDKNEKIKQFCQDKPTEAAQGR